jgi:quercetin dioxygenase-like cupin family protein
MKLELIRWDESRQGPLTAQSMKNFLQDKGYSVNQYHYPPGTCFPAHTHDVDKIDGVLSGRFKMTMYGQSINLQAGDMLIVPRGTVHSAEVIGNDAVLSLDAIKY